MRAGVLPVSLALLFQAAVTSPAPDPHHFQYTRGLSIASGAATAACAVLDATVYAHAAPSLADLRLYGGDAAAGSPELPYALTLSESATTADPARVLNRGVHGRHLVFDLAMPSRPYTHVNLDLGATNFIAKASVTGGSAAGQAHGTYLGTFTLFDLSAQSLARNATLPLSESTFPYLHVDLDMISSAPHGEREEPLDAEIVRGAEVPPSREAQTIFTTVAQSGAIAQRGRETIAIFHVPAHVPVERITFDLPAGSTTNFSRGVAIRARAQGTADAMTETLEGRISRIRMTEHGEQLNLETLSVPATVGSNAQASAEIGVAIDNGDDRPIALSAVRLEMRERRLCFDVPAAGAAVLFYGDPALHAPVYDYSRLFNPAGALRTAALQPERTNPLFQPQILTVPFTERHPALMWIALLAVVAVLGGMAWRSARRLA